MNTMTTIMDRSKAFGLLSSMYLCKPTTEAIDGWKSLLADDASPELDDLRNALNGIDTATAQTMEDLLWEYTRLFIGPYKLPCPPWESVYTSAKKLMMQDAADGVKKAYADYGLSIDDPGVMPDHIGAELNFLALVLRQRAEHPDKGAYNTDVAKLFVNDHLRKWVPAFTRDLGQASAVTLYKTLARTTNDLLDLLCHEIPC